MRHVSPAVYKNVAKRVLVREARTRKIHSPAVTAIVHRKVLLKPAERHVVRRPAIIGTKHEPVRVREGGRTWRASHRRRLLGNLAGR
ncbi:MAG: hypothetical protein ACWGMY_04660 [Hyphomicrobiaceae bacterium]